jgi:predicted N-formylglutamate amidohydrolase
VVGRVPYGAILCGPQRPACAGRAVSLPVPGLYAAKAIHYLVCGQGETGCCVAFVVEGEDRPGRWLVTCDHASNRVPDWVNGGDLGIAGADMARHIAWDVGAAGLARALAERLDSPAILSDFSRLVIDPNRGEDDPTLVMRLYDGTIIPANRHLTESDIDERLTRLYRPYHAAYACLADRRPDTVILAIHSFTPCLKGRAPRPWHVGVLHSHLDSRLSLPLIARLRAEPDLCIGDNEPYSGHLPGDAIDRHALRTGRHNTLVELRNDLIATAEAQALWADRLASILQQVLGELTDG